jgi:hypothetical protein
MLLGTGTHFKVRFRDLLEKDAVWFEYDDLLGFSHEVKKHFLKDHSMDLACYVRGEVSFAD